MSCTYDVVKVVVDKEEYAKRFATSWKQVLGMGDYLTWFDEDEDVFECFDEDDVWKVYLYDR